MNKMKYECDGYKEEVLENKIYDYKKTLLTKFNESDKNNNSVILLKRIFEPLMYERMNLEEKRDWRCEICTHPEFLKYSFDINALLRYWILQQVSHPFTEIFYLIEKYFAFESILKGNTFAQNFDNNLIALINNHFKENLGKIKANNANQANQVDVCFDLKCPFILREVETLDAL